jgi:hypothetical protein
MADKTSRPISLYDTIESRPRQSVAAAGLGAPSIQLAFCWWSAPDLSRAVDMPSFLMRSNQRLGFPAS